MLPLLQEDLLLYDGIVEGFYAPFAGIPQVATYLAYVDIQVMGNPLSQGYSSRQLLNGHGPANADRIFMRGYQYGEFHVEQALST